MKRLGGMNPVMWVVTLFLVWGVLHGIFHALKSLKIVALGEEFKFES